MEGPARDLAGWRRRRRRWLDEDRLFLALVVTCGALAGVISTVYRSCTAFLTRLFSGGFEGTILESLEHLPWWWKLGLPPLTAALAALIAWSVQRSEGGAGVGGIMEIVALGRRRDRWRPVLLKSASASVGIAGGASVGQEGPIAALSTSVAARVGARARLSDEPFKILTACALSASIAAAYNTPMSATLFVLEIIVGSLNPRFLGPALLASVTSTVVSRTLTGRGLLYPARFTVESHIWELGSYLLLGLATGLAAALFQLALRWARAGFRRLALPYPVQAGLGGLVLGGIGATFPFVFGNGYTTINRLLAPEMALPIGIAALLVPAKILATSMSSGSGLNGGIFTPMMTVGAACGLAVGQLFHSAAPDLFAPGFAYVALGMGGVIAGATRAPFLAILMPFELTGQLGVFVPQTLVVLVSIQVARRINRDSIYTEALRAKGIIWEGSPEERVLRSLKVRDIIRRDVPLLPETLPFPKVLEVFLDGRNVYAYVGTEEGRFRGVIDIHDLKEVLTEDLGDLVLARDLVRPIPVVQLDEPLTDVNKLLWYQDVGQLPVVRSDEDDHFEGIITRRDLLAAFDREVLRRNVMLSRFARTEEGGARSTFFEMPKETTVEQIRVPASLVGRAIGEAQIRARYGVNVLTISRLDDYGVRRVLPAEPSTVFEAGDHITVLGMPSNIENLRES